ncbi:uncharacterized protein J7T54_006606 [Emericellopsis cladophorae]|uniref:Uncharacterized protein n=1 Tax=Emericellopsis cladophorae TaxID=2686198 RepID=A0A9P9Y6Z8_9HYPO|nr:uncharacterized protein J7T54_006606 [Emericellopsis cladophorae]KAI6784561.1 hypothetical protein J7T54_006606 [Emericellopsis cladophorae]
MMEVHNALGLNYEVSDPDYYRKVLIKMYWDDSETPNVLALIGDFFCLGYSMAANCQSLPFTVPVKPSEEKNFGVAAAFNCYLPMPFNKRARIEIENHMGQSPAKSRNILMRSASLSDPIALARDSHGFTPALAEILPVNEFWPQQMVFGDIQEAFWRWHISSALSGQRDHTRTINMHYIRCLRPPKMSKVGKIHQFELLFVISTDLGDSLLVPDEPLEINVRAALPTASKTITVPLTKNGQLFWKPGQRVLKQGFSSMIVSAAIDCGRAVEICISVADELSARSAQDVLDPGKKTGLVMPLFLTLDGNMDGQEVSVRKIILGEDPRAPWLQIVEDLGEPKSLARHVWDGGVVAVCGLAETTQKTMTGPSQGECLIAIKDVLTSPKPLNILELGCGVGLLGLGFAAASAQIRFSTEHERTVLMTDLQDAEEQVRANIHRASTEPGMSLDFESLDWEQGRQGHFGSAVKARYWDLIMFSDCTYNVDVLPALVGTLSTLHEMNAAHPGKGPTRLFMATKPRHSSENEVFALLAKNGWVKRVKQVVRLPVMGADDQRVELYSFEKS